MLLPLRDLVELYRRIQTDSMPGKASVVILTAADVDALAALYILTTLLRADCIQYSIVPMHSITRLNEKLSSLEKMGATLRSVVCLNCGAMYDLAGSWPAENAVNMYVVDCHRPVYHTNVHHERIIVTDDHTDRNLENLPLPGEYEAVMNLSEENISQPSESDPEESDEERKAVHKRKREQYQEHFEKRVKVETYYDGNYFGASSAWVMFGLAKALNRDSNDMLWMALVGITEQLVHLKIDKFQYEQHCKDIKEDIIRLNAQSAGDGLEDSLPEVGRVAIELGELRVMLLRHWTLYESLFYSNTVASRLGTWKQQGRDKFHSVLVKMGVSLRDSQQLYKFMPGKSELKAKSVECLSQFNLDELLCTSYVRQYDLRTQFSSADVVYAISALLECPEVVEQDADEGFWLAYDALTDLELMHKGAQMAIDLHKAIFALGTSLIEKKAINPTNSFRYAIVNNDSWEQSRFFHYPHALKRLCTFLMEAYKEQRPSIKSKPMVLAMLNSRRGVYLVIGVMAYDSCTRNTFRLRFNSAINQTEGQSRFDFLDAEYVEVSKDNFQAFFDMLTNEREEH